MTSKDGTHEAIATVPGVTFRNGTIDVDVSGAPVKGAADSARGFIGIIFRQQKNSRPFEIIYIRPTNGRADDQLRPQSHRAIFLRTRMAGSLRVLRRHAGRRMDSHANGRQRTRRRTLHQPRRSTLPDHARPEARRVRGFSSALWTGPDTDGYFRNLTITN